MQHGYLSEGEGEDEQDRLESRENPEKRAERLKAVVSPSDLNLFFDLTFQIIRF